MIANQRREPSGWTLKGRKQAGGEPGCLPGVCGSDLNTGGTDMFARGKSPGIFLGAKALQGSTGKWISRWRKTQQNQMINYQRGDKSCKKENGW